MSADEYRVIPIDLPYTVNALVSIDDDGFPTILVNAHLSFEKQRKELRHELDHIENDDIHAPDLVYAEHRARTA